MKNSIKYLTAAAVALGLSGVAFAVPATGPALELSSGATTTIIQDNAAGDLNSAAGAISWLGTINGWTVTITSGVTKPIQGSVLVPNMDLAVQATGGSGLLTLEFTDTGFGPTAGLIDTFSGNNGTSTATSAAYYDTGNGQFALTSTVPTSLLLANPYSVTIVDTFTPGTVSTDDRVQGAPDGGSTVMLLGAALSTVGLLRKKLTT